MKKNVVLGNGPHTTIPITNKSEAKHCKINDLKMSYLQERYGWSYSSQTKHSQR